MPDNKTLDPTGERAEATEAMEATPISGKEHEYRADGDHRPRQNAVGETVTGGTASEQDAAPEAGVETQRHISEGIPGAGRSSESDPSPGTRQRERGPRS